MATAGGARRQAASNLLDVLKEMTSATSLLNREPANLQRLLPVRS